jgi:hypothetical protein
MVTLMACFALLFLWLAWRYHEEVREGHYWAAFFRAHPDVSGSGGVDWWY